MRADAVLLQKNGVANPPALEMRASPAQVAVAIVAGIAVQAAFYYFWHIVLKGLVGPYVLPFGRTPDQVMTVILPFLGGLVAASYHPRGWWWLGQGLAFPAFWSMHLLFAAGIEMAFTRHPTLAEEGRFLMLEGHRLLAGFFGSYLGALLQRE